MLFATWSKWAKVAEIATSFIGETLKVAEVATSNIQIIRVRGGLWKEPPSQPTSKSEHVVEQRERHSFRDLHSHARQQC